MRELNAPVYELYGLAEEEITIVEGRNHWSTEGSDHTERPALSRAEGGFSDSADAPATRASPVYPG